jgi:hypothetical protein
VWEGGWMVGWTDGQTDEQTVRQTDRHISRQRHLQVDESASCQHIHIGSCHVGR